LEEERLKDARLEEERQEDIRLKDVRLEEERQEDIRLKDVRLEEERQEDIRLEEERQEDVRQEEERLKDVRLEEERQEDIKLEEERIVIRCINKNKFDLSKITLIGGFDLPIFIGIDKLTLTGSVTEMTEAQPSSVIIICR
jgi:hypothetical protein